MKNRGRIKEENMDKKKEQNTYSLQYITFARYGISVYEFSEKTGKNLCLKQFSTSSIAVYNHDGSQLAIVEEAKKNTVQILSANSFAVIQEIVADGEIQWIYYSPVSNNIVILSKYNEVENKNNLFIYNLKEKKKKYFCSFRTQNKMNRPHFKWSDKEKFCCRLVGSEIHVCKGDELDFVNPLNKIQLEKIVEFDVSPESSDGKAYVAVYTAETKFSPASINIFDLNNFAMKINRRFNQSQDITFKWSCRGTFLLALSQTDVDVTGKSYYGSNKLFFFKADGRLDELLLNSEEGPVHDFQWSPTQYEFLVIKGPMPAETALYDGETGKAIMCCGNLMRNTIRWNIFGNFFLLGGFKGLAGNINVVDKETKTEIGSANVELAVECEFAPDGRYILISTTTPRLRVDNGIKIYKYNGELIAKENLNELYSACWRPVIKDKYKQRSISPPRKEDNKKNVENEKSKLFVPQWKSGQLANIMREERKTNEMLKITMLKNTPKEKPGVLPPGFAPVEKVSKSSMRNARRKKGKEKKKFAEEANAEKNEKEHFNEEEENTKKEENEEENTKKEEMKKENEEEIIEAENAHNQIKKNKKKKKKKKNIREENANSIQKEEKEEGEAEGKEEGEAEEKKEKEEEGEKEKKGEKEEKKEVQLEKDRKENNKLKYKGRKYKKDKINRETPK